MVTSSSDALECVQHRDISHDDLHTYRPGSYSLEAIGDISECIEMMPSSGLSGVGLTILPSTCARTLKQEHFEHLS